MTYGVVYVWTCLNTNLQYVGQTVSTLHERWKGHIHAANEGIDWHFPKAIREHGVDNFVGQVLCECDTPEDLSAMENYWMHKLNTLSPNGYNMRDGINFTCDQTRKLISERTKRAMSDPELRQYLSEKAKTRPVCVEAIEAMAQANRGKNHSEKSLQKMRAHKFSDEHKRNLSFAMKGKQKSVEHRKKLSEALKGRVKRSMIDKMEKNDTKS